MYSAPIMTKEDVTERVGRAMIEFGEICKHTKLLEDEMRKAGRLMEEIGPLLRMDPERALSSLNRLPDSGALQESGAKLGRAIERRNELRNLLRNWGIVDV